MLLSRLGVIGVLLLGIVGGTANAAVEPFLELRLNVSNIIGAVERAQAREAELAAADLADADLDPADEVAFLEEMGDDAEAYSDGPSPSFEESLALVKALGIDSLHLFLYPDEELDTVPVIQCRGVDTAAMTALLDTGLLTNGVEKIKDGYYRIKDNPEEEAEGIPTDRFRLWVLKSSVMVAPTSLAKAWSAGEPSPLNTGVAKLASKLQTDDDLFTLAVKLPDALGDDIDEVLADHALLAADGGPAAAVATMASDILDELVEPLRKLKAFAFRLGVKPDHSRSAMYAQWFHDAADATAAHQAFKAGGMAEDAEGILSALLGVVEDDATRLALGVKDNRLLLTLGWTEEDDEIVGEALMGAVLGMMFSGSMDMSFGPDDDGPVSTSYISDPVITMAVDTNALQTQLRDAVQGSLFPGHYWGNGDTPHLSVACDYMTLPNMALSELSFDLLSVTAPDGTSILRKDERGFSNTVSNDPKFPGNLQVTVAKGTPAESLGNATIRFTLEAPAELVVFRATSNDVGEALSDGGVRIKIKRLSGSSVSLTFKGAEEVKLFAQDATGRYIDDSSSSWTDSSMSSSFRGQVDRLTVVAVRSTCRISVDETIDLCKGQGVKLPDEPADDVPIRYNHETIEPFRAYQPADVSAWAVAWDEDDEGGTSGELKMAIEDPVFKGSHDWKICYFGADAPLAISGNGGSHSGFHGDGAVLGYYAQNKEDAKIHAAYGSVDVTVPSAVVVHAFNRPSAGGAVEFTTPAGMALAVSFDRNEVQLKAPTDRVLAMQVLDQAGKALKEGGNSLRDGIRRIRYWGQPASVVLHVADDQITRHIPVDLVRDGVDTAAYARFKKDLADLGAVIEALEAARQGHGRRGLNAMDDTLAGAHYLFDRNGAPAGLIDQALAHADPAGAERYGYELTPYKGYYFTLAKGTIKDGETTDYARDDKQIELRWEKGSFAFARWDNAPAVVAIPADGEGGFIMYSWGKPSIKFMKADSLDYIPAGAWPEGWIDYRKMPQQKKTEDDHE